MYNKDIISKISKLLALAGNNPSAEEAEAAMLKAQELMAKHSISMTEVKGGESPKKDAITHIIQGGHKSAWKMALARLISSNFRCDYLKYVGEGILFVGLEEDLQICISIYNYATLVLDKGMKKIRKEYRKQGRPTDGVAETYATGFIKGLQSKFNEQIKEQKWEIVLVKDSAVVEKTQSLITGKSSTRGLKNTGDLEAFQKGFKAGKSCGTPQKQLN